MKQCTKGLQTAFAVLGYFLAFSSVRAEENSAFEDIHKNKGVSTETTNTFEKTNQTVITATRIKTPIEQVGSSISVIDSVRLKQQQPKTVQDALNQTLGLQLVQNGGPGTASSVFMRGANANHTLVLVNGVRINSNTAGDAPLSRIPTESIERIEILKGTQSALYGSDAIGGVINIITKKGVNAPLSGSISLAIGEKGYSEEILSLTGGNEILDFVSSFSYSELNGYDIADHKNNKGTEDDRSRRLSFFTDVGLNFLEDGRADLTVLYSRNDTDLDNTAFWPNYWQVDDPDRDAKTEQWVTSLDVSKPITERYTQSLRASYTQEKNTGQDNGMQEYLFQTKTYGLTAQSDLQVLDNDTLSLGYEARRYEAQNEGNFDEEQIDQHSAFISNQLDLYETLFITLGGRYDDYSAFDSRMTWNAAASWFVQETTRIHGNIGTGYKVPAMNDLYWPADATGSGNSDLSPETSTSFDLGIEQALLEDRLVADITYFKSTIKDMIVWAETSPWFWQPSNLSQAEIQGVEVSLTAKPIDHLSTTAWYTYTDATDAETGNELARRAKHTAGLSANLDYSKRGSVYAGCTYTGERYDDGDNTRQMGGFVTVNTGTHYQVSDRFSVFASVENLLDKQYETAAGYGIVGRLASVGVKGKF